MPSDVAGRVAALSRVTGLAVEALDETGAPVAASGERAEYCRILAQYLPAGETCTRLHTLAGRRAVDLGEAYLFSCHAGVCHIAMPLMRGDDYAGSVIVGPFLLGELDALLIQDVARRYPLKTDALIDLYEAAGDIRVYTAEQAGALQALVGYLFHGDEHALDGQRRRSQQQRHIGEMIQMYKGFEAAKPAYPYEKERELVLHVKAGDAPRANALLNDLLGFALFSTGGRLESIKSHTAELCSLLSRAAIEAGIEVADALTLSHSYMRKLWQAQSIEELCQFMQEVVERFSISAFPKDMTGERAMLMRAMRFVSLHYAEPITLHDAAREAHLSESYFSTLFKRASGVPFRAYLNAVRIDEARHLLASGAHSVTEIALMVGFENQSYFSKVFRKVTGQTPKQYRMKLHGLPNE